jgi:hypothetical protein
VEYPYIRNIYQLFGQEANIENLHLPLEGHDYGLSKRIGAYKFLAKQLNLSLPSITNAQGEIDESFVKVEEPEKLRVFNSQHPRPTYAAKGDEAVSNLLKAKR